MIYQEKRPLCFLVFFCCFFFCDQLIKFLCHQFLQHDFRTDLTQWISFPFLHPIHLLSWTWYITSLTLSLPLSWSRKPATLHNRMSMSMSMTYIATWLQNKTQKVRNVLNNVCIKYVHAFPDLQHTHTHAHASTHARTHACTHTHSHTLALSLSLSLTRSLSFFISHSVYCSPLPSPPHWLSRSLFFSLSLSFCMYRLMYHLQ